MLQYESGIQQLFFFTTMHALLKASNPYSRLNFIFFPPQLNTNNSQREQESSSSKVRRRKEVGQTNEELVRNKIFLCSSAKIESM